MTREELLVALNTKFSEDIIDTIDKSQKRIYIEIKPESISKISEYLFKELGLRFNIASGLDARTHFEILYHFTAEDINLVISLRVKLDKKKPEIDSLAVMF